MLHQAGVSRSTLCPPHCYSHTVTSLSPTSTPSILGQQCHVSLRSHPSALPGPTLAGAEQVSGALGVETERPKNCVVAQGCLAGVDSAQGDPQARVGAPACSHGAGAGQLEGEESSGRATGARRGRELGSQRGAHGRLQHRCGTPQPWGPCPPRKSGGRIHWAQGAPSVPLEGRHLVKESKAVSSWTPMTASSHLQQEEGWGRELWTVQT